MRVRTEEEKRRRRVPRLAGSCTMGRGHEGYIRRSYVLAGRRLARPVKGPLRAGVRDDGALDQARDCSRQVGFCLHPHRN